MKTAKHIYEKIITRENIKAAIDKASQDKKPRREVVEVLEDVDKHVELIREMLISKSYRPCEYKETIVKEGARQKERKVTKIDFFPDQIIHWAVILQIQPLIERGAYTYSCGSMPGKGIHYAKPKIEKWIREDKKNTKYVAKLDITKYYESISHDLAKQSIRRIIKDPNLLWLLDMIIDSYPKGLPIGYLTSQWLANLILQPLDWFIKQVLKIKYYVRYMDDKVLFSSNKKLLHLAVRKIMEFLRNMGLKIKKNWQVFRLSCRALDFMGFRFYRFKTTLRRSLMYRISRKAYWIWKRGFARFKDAAAMLSYLGWIKHSDSRWFFESRFVKYVNIKELKNIVRRYSRKELGKYEIVLLRKRRYACSC